MGIHISAFVYHFNYAHSFFLCAIFMFMIKYAFGILWFVCIMFYVADMFSVTSREATARLAMYSFSHPLYFTQKMQEHWYTRPKGVKKNDWQ